MQLVIWNNLLIDPHKNSVFRDLWCHDIAGKI